MHAFKKPLAFKARIALAGLFMFGLFAAAADASAGERVRRQSFNQRPAISKQAPTRPPVTSPAIGNVSRLSPGAPGGLRPSSPHIDRTRLSDTGLRPQPVATGPARVLPPGAGLVRPDLSPPTGVVKDGDRTGASSALPTPSDEDRNKRLGACLVGIVSACNGNAPPASPGAGQPGAGQPGDGGRVPRAPVAGDPPSAQPGGGGGGSGGGGGGSFSFSPSFSFGSGDTAAAAPEEAAPAKEQAAAAACVADPSDVYKLLECNIDDFKSGRIERREYEARKDAALALLDPAKLGSDLVFRVLRELVDLNLITAEDREARKRALIAQL